MRLHLIWTKRADGTNELDSTLLQRPEYDPVEFEALVQATMRRVKAQRAVDNEFANNGAGLGNPYIGIGYTVTLIPQPTDPNWERIDG